MGKSKKPDQGKPTGSIKDQIHGTKVGDKVSGDSLFIECRKPGDWHSFRMSGNHNGWQVKARKNASATVEVAYTSIKGRSSSD